MIRHEAVGKICEVKFLRRTQEMPLDQRYVFRVREKRTPIPRAESEEVLVAPDIVEAIPCLG